MFCDWETVSHLWLLDLSGFKLSKLVPLWSFITSWCTKFRVQYHLWMTSKRLTPWKQWHRAQLINASWRWDMWQHVCYNIIVSNVYIYNAIFKYIQSMSYSNQLICTWSYIRFLKPWYFPSFFHTNYDFQNLRKKHVSFGFDSPNFSWNSIAPKVLLLQPPSLLLPIPKRPQQRCAPKHQEPYVLPNKNRLPWDVSGISWTEHIKSM